VRCAVQSTNGARPESAESAVAVADVAPVELATAEAPTILKWRERTGNEKLLTKAKLSLALPQRRFKKGSFLTMKLEGARCTALLAVDGCFVPYSQLACTGPRIAATESGLLLSSITRGHLCPMWFPQQLH
jgi:hypothetical protein